MTVPLTELFLVIGLSAAQALVSATIIVALGLLAAFGLAPIRKSNIKKSIELILLAPSLMPTLLTIVASLDLASFFGRFPIGFWGVVVVHFFVNAGLAAVSISQLIESRLSGIIELGTIEGASKFQLIKLSVRELSEQLRNIFIFFFILCFASFSIPLVVGAQTGRTVETLIYETLLDHNHFKLALFYSAIQVALIGAFSLFRRQNISAPSLRRAHPRFLDRVSLGPFLWALISLSVLLVVGLLGGTAHGLSEFGHNSVLLDRVTQGALGTFFEALSVGGLVTIISCLVVFLTPSPRLHQLLLAFSVPSAAALGFLLVAIFDLTEWPDFAVVMLISVGFAILIFSTIHRMRLGDALLEIQGSVESAQIFGANRWLRFSKIIWPQIKNDIAYLAGLSALWASCDFAFASMLAGRDLTLGVTAHGLLAGYRSEIATIVALLATAIGVVTYFIFRFFLTLELKPLSPAPQTFSGVSSHGH